MATAVPYFSNLAAENKSTKVSSYTFRPALKDTKVPSIGCGLPSKTRGIFNYTPSPAIKTPSTIFGGPKGILEEAETSAVLERDFLENNKAKFLDLASTDTVKDFAKLAQKRVNSYNPLARPSKSKKKRVDIFD